MGWNPIKDIKRGIKDVGGYIKDPLSVIKDPKKLAEGYGAFRIGGLPGTTASNNKEFIKKGIENLPNDVKNVNPYSAYFVGQSGGIPGVVAVDQLKQGMKGEEPPKAGSDPRLTDIQNQMVEDARKYREGLETTRGQRMGGLLSEFQEAGREGTRRTRENYSRRGLLYSGLKKSGEESLKGKLASELSRGQAGIRQETEQIAQAKERAAAAAGLENAMMLMNQAEQYYNMSMQNDLARRRAFGLLGQGMGRAAGAYYGNQAGIDATQDYNYSGGSTNNYATGLEG